MNLAWNSVNLVIAGFGYYNALNAGSDLTLLETFAEQKGIENILLLNAGLDVGYMLGGLYLLERSKNVGKRQDILKGFGQSIILQGGFLFAFDVIMRAHGCVSRHRGRSGGCAGYALPRQGGHADGNSLDILDFLSKK